MKHTFNGIQFVLVLSFALLLLTGEAFGAPYILFYYYGAFSGITYSMLTSLGIILIALAYYLNIEKSVNKAILNIVGNILLVFSLINFFLRERLHQSSSIRWQIIPIICLAIFSLLVVIIFFKNIAEIFKELNKRTRLPQVRR